ncbi:MAG TPA: AAA family ATPase [Vicinamibacterales bacterium]|nr:AAA family ATPase [Vicinamibacterales bacterium]
MIVGDQREVIEFLASPSTHGGHAVERIETHSAIVFLAGSRALKLKRAVRFDYLDFSTPQLRRKSCDAEVRLNQRTAPTLYRGVLALTRTADGGLELSAPSPSQSNGFGAVDWVVEMERFDQEALFDRLAAAGRLSTTLMAPLGAAIARFHAAAAPRRDHGGKAGMQWVVDGNAAGFADDGAGVLDSAACRRVTEASSAAVERHGGLLEARRDAGWVRQCHGDLHLRNIVLLEGRPTLFDGVEFNDEIACTDVLYDLAFLLMDLWRRRLPRHANEVWNAYLRETDQTDGNSLLPLFLSCRAAVRAKTSATAARLQSDAGRRDELNQLARDYLALAETLLRPEGPRIIAIGGLSGSGKSTVAMALAPMVGAVPGAVVLRSDEIRKQLLGVRPLDRLGPEGYAQEVSMRVYATMAERASRIVRGGHSAIVDAVHLKADDRHAIERVAKDAAVPFAGIWLDAPDGQLIERAGARAADPSDADASVIRQQLAQDTGPIGWQRVDASGPIASVLGQVVSILQIREAPVEQPITPR